MKFNTTTFLGFNRNFFDLGLPLGCYHSDILDKTVVFSMKNGSIAEVELVENGTHETYEGYLVKIIHPKNGKLAAHYFSFNEYLTVEVPSGIDPSNKLGMQIIKNCGIDWYINHPTKPSIFRMVREMLKYIKLYDKE